MGIDSGRITRAAAPTWVNIAREISKWLLECSPRSAPSRRKAAPHGLHRKGPEVRIGKWNIYRIEHHRMTISRQLVAIMLVATGKPVARRTPPSLHVRRSPVLRRMDLRLGKNIIQPFAQRNGFIKQPCPLGSTVIRASGKRFFNARTVRFLARQVTRRP